MQSPQKPNTMQLDLGVSDKSWLVEKRGRTGKRGTAEFTNWGKYGEKTKLKISVSSKHVSRFLNTQVHFSVRYKFTVLCSRLKEQQHHDKKVHCSEYTATTRNLQSNRMTTAEPVQDTETRLFSLWCDITASTPKSTLWVSQGVKSASENRLTFHWAQLVLILFSTKVVLWRQL